MKNKKTLILFILLLGLFLYPTTKDTIINHKKSVNITPVTTVTGTIKWLDNNNINGKRPDKITIDLYKVGNQKLDEQTLDVTGDCTYVFKNVDSNYSKVTSSRVEDYIVMIDGYDITYKYISNNNSEYPSFFDNDILFTKIDENNNYLSEAEFKLKTLDEKNEVNISEDQEEQLYYSEESEINFVNLESLLSKTQSNAVKSIKTIGDFANFYGVEVEYEPQMNEMNSYGEKVDYFDIHLPTFFVLEETKAPSGYVKTKALIPGEILIQYTLKESDIDENDIRKSKIEIEKIYLQPIDNMNYFDYDDYNEEDYLGIDIDKAEQLWIANATKKGCVISSKEEGPIDKIDETKLKQKSLNSYNTKEYGEEYDNPCPIVIQNV